MLCYEFVRGLKKGFQSELSHLKLLEPSSLDKAEKQQSLKVFIEFRSLNTGAFHFIHFIHMHQNYNSSWWGWGGGAGAGGRERLNI